jgi:hypothetical protein
VRAFVRDQYERGAVVCGICAGALVLAEAGLLDGRRATTHWYEIDGLQDAAPDVRLVRDRRYVADGRLVTTTGVTASLPVSLALVEAARGRGAAQALAAELGVADWTARHDSAAFSLGLGDMATAALGWANFWRRRTYEIPVSDGVDEIALALTADALARTFRSSAVAVGPDSGSDGGSGGGSEGGSGGASAAVTGASGLAILPARAGQPDPEVAVPLRTERPALALDDALARIESDYGAGVADFVALQLEHPRAAASL